jgi:thiol:disulfide interchange protein DsbD
MWFLGARSIMKIRCILLLALCSSLIAGAASAQVGGSGAKVTWTYAAKKISNELYEVHMTARIASGWRLYSQKPGAYSPSMGGTPFATSFRFTANPKIALSGSVKEVGHLMSTVEAGANGKLKVNYYMNEVDFAQDVKLKGSPPTELNGRVEFMVSNGQMALSPTDASFSVSVR